MGAGGAPRGVGPCGAAAAVAIAGWAELAVVMELPAGLKAVERANAEEGGGAALRLDAVLNLLASAALPAAPHGGHEWDLWVCVCLGRCGAADGP